jgi:hypothetical protein
MKVRWWRTRSARIDNPGRNGMDNNHGIIIPQDNGARLAAHRATMVPSESFVPNNNNDTKVSK